MTKRITFRKKKQRSFSAAAYEARRDGVQIATIQAHGKLWFWYGGGRNTAGQPKDLEGCKADIKEHFKP